MKTDRKILILALFCFLVVPICTGIISCYYFSRVDRKVELRQKIDVKDEVVGTNTLSIYLETAEGSGEYTLSDSDVFLTDGYTFNEEKSKCENGGLLSFDESTGKVRMTALASDRCYVYFNKGIPSLGNFADYIKNLYTTQGANGLYLHNGTLANGAGDNSYRYAGAHDTVNNFVCFGTDAESCPNDNLYRIIGIFGNQVKLIKYDYATKEQLGTNGNYDKEQSPVKNYKGSLSEIDTYYWDVAGTINWNESKLNTVNLNETYLNNLGSTWTDKIATTTWNVGGVSLANGMESNAKTAYDYEVGVNKINKTYEAKVGLMYLSEYYYSALPTHWIKPGYNSDSSKDYSSAINDNWMYMGGWDAWTITPSTDYDPADIIDPDPEGLATDQDPVLAPLSMWDTYYAFTVYDSVYYKPVYEIIASMHWGVRPSFSLASSVELASGSGTKGDPYRIKI